MKIQALDIKRLRKRSIKAVRNILKQYNMKFSVADDKEKLLGKIEEVQKYAKKIQIYSRYDFSM